MVLRSSFVAVVLTVCLAGLSMAGVQIEEAILAGEWQNVHDNIQQADELSPSIREFIYGIACLELDLGCSPFILMTSLPIARKHDQENEWAMQLFRDNPSSSIGAFLVGAIHGREGDRSGALTYYTRAIELDKSNAMAHLYRSIQYATWQKHAQAIEELDIAIESRPGHSLLYTNRGASYDGLGKYEEALADYDKAISINPGFQVNYYNRGNTYRHKGDNESAIVQFTKAIMIDSSAASAFLNRGNAFSDEGRFDEALNDYQQFISIANEESQQHVKFARWRSKAISKLLKKYPSDKAARLIQWAVDMFEQGESKIAQKFLTEAIAIDSTKSDAYYWLAGIYSKTGNSQGALENFSKAIFYKPNDTTAYFNRALLLSEKGQHGKAIEDYTSAIDLDKTYAKAYMNRARSYEQTGKVNLAIIDYQRSLKLTPKSQLDRRKNIENILKILRSGSKVEGIEDARSSIETLLTAWEDKKWFEMTSGTNLKDLEKFRELSMPFSEKIGNLEAAQSKYFSLYGNIYSWENMKNWTPQQYFTIHLQLLSSEESQFHDYFNMSLVKVTEVLARSSYRVMYSARITIGSKEQQQELTIEGYATRVDTEWKLDLPSIFLNVAQELSKY